MPQIVTVMTDDTGDLKQFVSPTILEAAHGISQAVLAAISRTGLVTVGKDGEKLKVPEKVRIKMYRAELNAAGTGVLGHTVQRMVELNLEFRPQRFEGVPRVPEQKDAEETAMEHMVSLS